MGTIRERTRRAWELVVSAGLDPCRSIQTRTEVVAVSRLGKSLRLCVMIAKVVPLCRHDDTKKRLDRSAGPTFGTGSAGSV